MAAKIGNLAVILSLDAQGFSTALGQAGAHAQKFGSALKDQLKVDLAGKITPEMEGVSRAFLDATLANRKYLASLSPAKKLLLELAAAERQRLELAGRSALRAESLEDARRAAAGIRFKRDSQERLQARVAELDAAAEGRTRVGLRAESLETARRAADDIRARRAAKEQQEAAGKSALRAESLAIARETVERIRAQKKAQEDAAKALEQRAEGRALMASRLREAGQGLAVGLGASPLVGVLGNTTTAFAALAASVVHVARTGATFEKWISRVGAVTQTAGVQLAALRQQALALGRVSVFAPTEIAQGMAELAVSGFKAEQVLQAMPSVIGLATADMISLADASRIAAQVMNNFGLQANNLPMVIDVLTRASLSSATSAMDLGESLKFVGAAAFATGRDIKQTSATLMALAKAGIRGEMGGTTLRGMIAKTSDESQEAHKTMKALGISFVKLGGFMMDDAEIVDELNQKLAGLTQEGKLKALFTMFEQRAAAGILALMNQGADEIRKNLEELNKSSGATEKAQSQMLDNLAGDWKKLANTFESVINSMEARLDPFFRMVIQNFKTTLEWLEQHAPLMQFFKLITPEPIQAREPTTPSRIETAMRPRGLLKGHRRVIESGEAGFFHATMDLLEEKETAARRAATKKVHTIPRDDRTIFEQVFAPPPQGTTETTTDPLLAMRLGGLQKISAEFRKRYLAAFRELDPITVEGIQGMVQVLDDGVKDLEAEIKKVDNLKGPAGTKLVEGFRTATNALRAQSTALKEQLKENAKDFDKVKRQAALASSLVAPGLGGLPGVVAVAGGVNAITEDIFNPTEFANFTKQLEDASREAKMQAFAFGQSAEAAQLYRLEMQALLGAKWQRFTPLLEQARKELMKFAGARVRFNLQTPLENLGQSILHLTEPLLAGTISFDEFTRASFRAAEGIRDLQSTAPETLLEGTGAAVSAVNASLRQAQPGSALVQTNAILEGIRALLNQAGLEEKERTVLIRRLVESMTKPQRAF